MQRSAPGIFVERITAQGEVEYTYGAYEPGGEKVTPKLPASITGPSGTGAPVHEFLTVPSTRAGGPQFRVLVTTSADGDRVIFAQPLDATAATLHQLLVIELLVTAGALLAAIVLGIWLVRVGLRPLQQVEETAEAITEGDLDRRVPGAEKRTEVGRLARVLNVMLARIQRAFAERDATEAQLRASEDRLRRFISDASHELRTPLAAVSAYAELYSQGASERPEDLGRVMRGIQSESARMKRLVEDLLLLARLDEGRPLEHEPVELVSLAADAVHAAAAVGPDWPISLDAERPVEVLGDPGRLRQVLDNLLANVRAHTPPGTASTVSVAEDGDVAVVQVADSGPGLPVDEAPHVFERFYRADPSRSRASGGSGLGLSIVGRHRQRPRRHRVGRQRHRAPARCSPSGSPARPTGKPGRRWPWPRCPRRRDGPGDRRRRRRARWGPVEHRGWDGPRDAVDRGAGRVLGHGPAGALDPQQRHRWAQRGCQGPGALWWPWTSAPRHRTPIRPSAGNGPAAGSGGSPAPPGSPAWH